jgi:DNA-binding protein WhiA
VVAAAQEQLNAIKILEQEVGIFELPEPLQQAAMLRIANPDVSLADLALLSHPPVTKSCLNHRMKKLVALAAKIPEDV